MNLSFFIRRCKEISKIEVQQPHYMSLIVRKPLFGVSDLVRHKPGCTVTEDRDLKFRILKVEGLYYMCSGNKGADELRGYREADLRLCFRIRKKLFFPITRLIL